MEGDVEIGLEPLAEHRIVEIDLEGNEVYRPPKTFVQHFSSVLSHIDFSHHPTAPNGHTQGGAHSPEKNDSPAKQTTEALVTKVNSALTEVCALYDLLQIARCKRYFAVDLCTPTAAADRNSEEEDALFLMVAKKKSFSDASDRLLAAEARFRTDAHTSRSQCSFFAQLIDLRKRWKLRKSGKGGGGITGDLSLSSTGSNYHHATAFEVLNEGGGGAASVKVPRDLENDYFLRVSLATEVQPCDFALTERSSAAAAAAPSDVHSQLARAQQSLINKEIFSQLCKEATHIKLSNPINIRENEITIWLDHDSSIRIELKKQCSAGNGEPQSPETSLGTLDTYVRKCFVHHFQEVTHREMPHPVTALLSVSREKRISGAFGEPLEASGVSCILEQLVERVSHGRMCERVARLVEEWAATSGGGGGHLVQLHCKWHRMHNGCTSHLCLSMRAQDSSYGRNLRQVVVRIDGTRRLSVTTVEGVKSDCSLGFLSSAIAANANHIVIGLFVDCGSSLGWAHMGDTGSVYTPCCGALMHHPTSSERLKLSIRDGKVAPCLYLWRSDEEQMAAAAAEDDTMQDLKFMQLAGRWLPIKLTLVPGAKLSTKFEHVFSVFR